jgi:murE/murF fusion protein
MLELGNHSKKLHRSIVPIINKTKVDKVFVKGKNMISIFDKFSGSKKGRILHKKSEIIELIKNDLNNNDYLMIKASNATGFNKIIKNLRGLN